MFLALALSGQMAKHDFGVGLGRRALLTGGAAAAIAAAALGSQIGLASSARFRRVKRAPGAPVVTRLSSDAGRGWATSSRRPAEKGSATSRAARDATIKYLNPPSPTL